LQSGLPYRTEAKITEVISRLEHQLQMQNFKLNEEKKIVAEIDALKRSRKDLGQVLSHFSWHAYPTQHTCIPMFYCHLTVIICWW